MLEEKSLQAFKETPEFKELVSLFTFAPEESNNYMDKLAEIFNSQQDKVTRVLEGVPMNVEMFLLYQSMVDTLNRHNLWKADTVNHLWEGIVTYFEFSDWTYDPKTEQFSRTMPFVEAQDYDNMVNVIPEMSLILYLLFPSDPFYPLLRDNINEFIHKCHVLGIETPDAKRIKTTEDKMWYYFELCCDIDNFRQKLGLTKEEMCALLYGYDESKYNEKDDDKDEVKE